MSCPDPGIYYDIPSEDYFAWDAISNSKLSLLKRSPLHFRTGFSVSTDAMRIGSLIHTALLEPLAIIARYTVMPDYSNHPENVTANGARSFSSATAFVKSMQEQFRKLNHEKEFVSQSELDMMLQLSASVKLNSVARDLLRDGTSEVSIVWTERLDSQEVTCKARIDLLKADAGQFVDLKTTQDAAEFERSIVKFGYHRQMAFYRRGLASVGIDAEPWLVAVEKSAPYGIRSAPMAADALRVGWKEVSELLATYVACRESDKWPGYPNPESWSLPEWYTRDEELELVIGGEVVSV